jgi:DNA-binding MarR family transcriptional regulator
LSRKESPRAELERELAEQLGRRLSGRTLLFHQAVAEKLGLNPTDLKCLDLARTETEITPGRIAEITGLTTAAVTSVIDRLEAGGLVRRLRDKQDRRKVMVLPVPEKTAEVRQLFGSLDTAMRQLCARYSLAELSLIRDFAAKVDDILQEQTLKLRRENNPPGGSR